MVCPIVLYLGIPLTYAWRCIMRDGRTPAMKSRGLRVVDEFGAPPSALRAFVRVALLPVSVLLCFWYPFTRRERLTVHDVVSKTYLIRDTSVSRND